MSDSKAPKNNISNFLNKIRPRGASPGKTPPPNAAKIKRSKTPLRFNFFSRFTSGSSKNGHSVSTENDERLDTPAGSSEEVLNITPPRDSESFNNMNALLAMHTPVLTPRGATSELDLRFVTVRGRRNDDLSDSDSDSKTEPQQFSSLTDVSGEIQTTPPSAPRQPSYLNISRALNGYGYRNRSSPLNTPATQARPSGRTMVERRLQTFRSNGSGSADTPLVSSAEPSQANSMATAVAADCSTPVRDLATYFETLRVSTPVVPPKAVKGLRFVFPKTVPHLQREESQAHSQLPVEKEERGGKYYDRLLNETRDKLQKKVDEGLAELKREEENMAEEAAAAIRVAQGKAALLIKKKISKFEELVRKNLFPDSSKLQETTIDDLEGYWGLIDIELKDIHSEFENVEEWRARGWQKPAVEAEPAAPVAFAAPPKPARRTKLPTSAAAKPKSEKDKARDEERRRQMAEFRKRAMLAKKQEEEGGKENNLDSTKII